MKTVKARITKSKSVVKKSGLYTVDVARMERYLADTHASFKERVKRTQASPDDFVGALVGPVIRRRA